MAKVPYDCLALPERLRRGAGCRNLGPSYEVSTRAEYLAWLKRCRALKDDPKAFYELGCKREAHVQVPGGRLKSRFAETEVPRVTQTTAERIAVGQGMAPPWERHTQSPKVWEQSKLRMRAAAEGKGTLEGTIERAIGTYLRDTPPVAGGYGFQVPQSIHPLLAVGMPLEAARVLVQRARGRVFFPPLKERLSGDETETEHSKLLLRVSTPTRVDYKSLRNVNLYDLPLVLARILRNKAKQNPSRTPNMARNYDYDDLFARPNMAGRPRAGGMPATKLGDPELSKLTAHELVALGGKKAAAELKRRGKSRGMRAPAYEGRDERPGDRALLKALRAKAAKAVKAVKAKPKAKPKAGGGKTISFVTKDGREVAFKVKAKAKANDYWVEDGPYSPSAGQFASEPFQPVNRRNPYGEDFNPSRSPWGYDMPPAYPFAMAQGQYGTFNEMPPVNRRNPRRDRNGRFVKGKKQR